MHSLILHHFDWSPFAEKARLALGLKRLAWHSVQIPMVLPKPDLMPLTGGYRKTPVLQVGADIYCDTRLIACELERRFPVPTLFPQGNRGVSLALSHWSDTAFFEPGAGLSMALNAEVPASVIELAHTLLPNASPAPRSHSVSNSSRGRVDSASSTASRRPGRCRPGASARAAARSRARAPRRPRGGS